MMIKDTIIYKQILLEEPIEIDGELVTTEDVQDYILREYFETESYTDKETGETLEREVLIKIEHVYEDCTYEIRGRNRILLNQCAIKTDTELMKDTIKENATNNALNTLDILRLRGLI